MVKPAVLLLMIWYVNLGVSQVDTSYVHHRKRAALFSLVVPGAGQIYNEIGHRKVQGRKHISWWRAPLYLSGLVVTGYYSREHALNAARYKKEWIYRSEHNDAPFHIELKDWTNDNLVTAFTDHATYRDYFIAGFFLVYGINVLDAYVDAHFVSFDVSKDLSFQLTPKYYGFESYGIGLSLSFK